MGLTEEQIHRPSRRGVVLERGRALQHRADAPGRQEGRRCGRRHAARVLHHLVTDGIAMGHQGMKSSLVSRQVIADSIEPPCGDIATTPWSA
jgi:dihydroxy-acid dehydratase